MKYFEVCGAGRFLALPLITVTVAALTGCGGHGSTATTPLETSTSVTVLLSSTANDQLSQYKLDLQSLTLISKSGTTVSLLTAPPSGTSPYSVEFMHLNGASSTLATTSIATDTYTSATLTVGGASFTCIAVNSSDGSLTTSTFAYGGTPQSQVTVNLPSPIVVSGDTLNLSMQLDEAKSYTLEQCPEESGIDTFSITPTFNLTTTDLSPAPTNSRNGKETNILGQVSATSGNGFSINIGYNPPGSSSVLPVQTITANANTLYQGISGLTSLTKGMFVDMDLAAQSDGSLQATRVAVHDPSAVDVITGPVTQTAASIPAIFSFAQQVEGSDELGNNSPFDWSKATFSISQQLPNLSSLPFTPVFEGANLVAGQNVYITTAAAGTQIGFNRYPLATTVTLVPQTLNGMVTAEDSSGDFETYTITLAPYNLFPALAGQMGSTNLVRRPTQVTVYVDSSAAQASTVTPSIGQTYRFHGLVFNDAGTLRMDCDEVDAGVTD